MAAPPRPGDVIAGKYRVERVLGRGGMGVVVAARHLRLRERVAIKFLLHGDRLYDDLVARFVREGRAAMRIRSEHVVRVHDIGTLETGEPFLVMEYLEGSDLGAIVEREGPLPIDAALEYVLQAIEALAEAHARGIVHRDLKPSNLFLSHRADGSPIVKVLDFGIAKSTRSGADTASASNAVVGTPAFMAPEQMRTGAVIDGRTDVFSIGATLHALLTGAPPFPPGSMVEVHERIRQGPAPVSASRPEVPPALDAVVLRCMKPDAQDRFADVAELAEALAELAPERAREYARRAAKIRSAAPVLGAATEASLLGDDDANDFPRSDDDATGAPADGSWLEDAQHGAALRGSLRAPTSGTSPSVVTSAPPRKRALKMRVVALAGLASAVALAVVVAWSRSTHHDAAAAHSASSPPGPSDVGAPRSPASVTSTPQAAEPHADPAGSASAVAPRPTETSTPSASPTPRAPRPAKQAPTARPKERPRDPLGDPD
jgi:eukaryotic-like serine/threonine-protein kinase